MLSATALTEKVELYCLSGVLKYKGDVCDFKKNGNGEEFWENGKVKYTGVFLDNYYEDENSKLYYRNGRLEYEGGFSEGNISNFYKNR